MRALTIHGPASRSRCLAAALAVLVWGVFAFADTSARAAILHRYEAQITGIPANGPHGAVPSPGVLREVNAMTAAGGDLYADDRGRFDAFEASSGAFVSQLSLQGGPGELERGIALGGSTGETELYAGSGAGVVGVFGDGPCGSLECATLQKEWTGADTPSGSFGIILDVAVDHSLGGGGDVFVDASSGSAIDVFRPEAGGKEEYVGQLTGTSPSEPFAFPTKVAVSGFNGDVVVLDSRNEETVVDLFEPAGLGAYAFVRRIVPPRRVFSAAGITVAVDAANGEIYAAGFAFENGSLLEPSVYQFSSSGELLGVVNGKETPAGGYSGIRSLTVDPVSGRVFVNGTSNSGSSVIDEFGRDVVIPDATTQAASSVQPAGATLNGIVNPDGVQVSDCRFEYGETTAYGQSVPCAQSTAQIGAGSSPVPVSAELSGLRPSVMYHFRLSVGNTNGVNTGADQPFGPPRIGGESSSEETQTTATLHAQVNPNGVDTTYQFQYGPTLSYGTNAPVSPVDLGSGTQAEGMSANLSALQAGVTYHYRLVAVNAAGTVDGPDHTFTTVPPARIDSVTVTNVTARSATLDAQIDPLGSETTYRFEYGPTLSYGGSVPVPDGNIGAGMGDVAVTQQLGGLHPDTTYHIRVVASNSLGIERSGDHTFVYDTTGEGLPDNRGYEMVTPPQKNAALIGRVFFGIPPDVSEDGSRVIMTSIQCFAGSGSCTASRQLQGQQFLFTRTGGGWVTTALAPSAGQFEADTGWRVSAQTGMELFSMPTSPMFEDDFYVREPGGSFIDIGPATPPSAGVQGTAWSSLAMTSDFSHIVFEESGLWPFATGIEDITPYEYVGTGNTAPVLVGVSGGAGSTDLISACGTELGESSSPGGVSADGETVYFIARACSLGTGANVGVPVPATAVYARIDQSRTVKLSERSPAGCTSVACQASPPGNAGFEGASADGSKAFFLSGQQLTDEASEGGGNLYEYDFGNPAGHNLIDASAGDVSGGGPRVAGVMAISADGSHVYFVAGGVLTATANDEGQSAQDGADNLYVFERDASHPQGRIEFIVTLTSSDLVNTVSPRVQPGIANVTPDGRFLAFTARSELTPDDTRRDGARQVFRYDALTGELVHVSVGEHGFNDNGNGSPGAPCESSECPLDASIVSAVEGSVHAGPARGDPTMSHDGAYVFFQSPIGLTPHALNEVPVGNGQNYASNVYEWHEGQVHLISDGRDTSAAELNGASSVRLWGSDATGANVFFSTADPLVAQDTDTQVDYYDARICTAGEPCVAQSPPPLAACLGEACHGTPAATPLVPSAPSATFSGSGNVSPIPAATAGKKTTARKKTRRRTSRCPAGRRRVHGKCVKRKAGRSRKANSHRGVKG
jgi:hypothetical protein